MATLERRHEEVGALLGTAEVINKRAEFMKLSREHAELDPLVARVEGVRRSSSPTSRRPSRWSRPRADAELREMAREEAAQLEEQRDAAEQQIKILLLPKDPERRQERDPRDPRRHRRRRGRAVRRRPLPDVLALRRAPGLEDRDDVDVGGHLGRHARKSSCSIEGKDVFSKLKFESGVHRVQRVPATEAQGRIHTSAATVAVLPEAEEVDVKIDENDLKIDTYRSSGAGGQHVNTTDSAVRITHMPTGVDRRVPGRALADQEPREGDEDAALEDPRGRAASGRRRPRPRRASRRSARAIAPRRSARTTSRRIASPITASA